MPGVGHSMNLLHAASLPAANSKYWCSQSLRTCGGSFGDNRDRPAIDAWAERIARVLAASDAPAEQGRRAAVSVVERFGCATRLAPCRWCS
jgi:hypothetical protein